MREIKSIWILIKANFLRETYSFSAVLLSILTPIVYTAVFFGQTYLYYQVNNLPFKNLPIDQYFVGLFVNQIIVFLNFEQNIRQLSKDILTGEFDFILLRPIKLFYYKYFQNISIDRVIMICLFCFGFVYSTIITGTSFVIISKLLLYILLASIIGNNVSSIIISGGVYFRDENAMIRMRESLTNLVQLKPQEVFPNFMQLILIYIIPFIVMYGFMFEIIRQYDDWYFWIILIAWSFVSMIINYSLWKNITDNYESIG